MGVDKCLYFFASIILCTKIAVRNLAIIPKIRNGFVLKTHKITCELSSKLIKQANLFRGARFITIEFNTQRQVKPPSDFDHTR